MRHCCRLQDCARSIGLNRDQSRRLVHRERHTSARSKEGRRARNTLRSPTRLPVRGNNRAIGCASSWIVAAIRSPCARALATGTERSVSPCDACYNFSARLAIACLIDSADKPDFRGKTAFGASGPVSVSAARRLAACAAKAPRGRRGRGASRPARPGEALPSWRTSTSWRNSTSSTSP